MVFLRQEFPMRNLHLPLAARVVIIYIIIGAVWTALADWVLAGVFINQEQLRIAKSLEDWFFIILSGLILFFYLNGEIKLKEQSEQKYARLFDHSIQGIFRSTLDGRLLNANPALAHMYGYDSPEEMLKSVTNIKKQIFVDPDLRDKFLETILAKDFAEKFESQKYRRNGSIIWTSTNAHLVRDSNGQPLYLDGFITDITTRKQTEAALKDAETRYRSLVEEIPAAVYSQDIRTNLNKTLYISPQIENITGYPPDQWTETDTFWSVIVLPEDRDFYNSENNRTNQTLENFDLEYRITTNDGRIIWLRDISRVAYDDEQKPLYWQGVLLDITEQKNAVQTQLLEERRFRAILENITDAISLLTADGRVLYQSPTIEKVLGFTSEERLGQNGLELVHRDDIPRIMSEYKTLAENPELNIITTARARHRNGEYRWLEVIGTNRLNDPAIQALVVNFRDITERVRAVDRMNRQLVELTTLHSVANAVVEINDIDEVIEQTTMIVSDNLYPDNCGILLLNNTGDALQPHVSYRGENPEKRRAAIPLSIGIAGKVASDGKSARINDVSEESAYIEVTSGVHSELCVPIRVNEKIIGVFNVESIKIGAFDEEDERLLNTLAGTLGTAIERIRLFNTEKERRQEAEKLREAATIVSSSLELSHVLHSILDSLQSVVPYKSASILLRESEHVRIAAANNLPNQEQALDQIFLLEDINTSRKPLILNDAQKDTRFMKWAADFVRGWMGVPMIAHGQLLGYIILDSVNPDTYNTTMASLAEAFANQAAIAIENAQLFENLQKSNLELSRAYDTTLEGWGNALELRDRETQGHTRRVADLTLELARRLGCSDEEQLRIRRGVLVHDIGKMGVPDSILNKKGPLTKKERAEMRKHPQYAFDLLYPIAYLRPAIEIPYCHHERWDGTGYPRGLKGEQIPWAARIFTVVDVWDALCSDRPYRKHWPRKKIVNYIHENEGIHFDPKIAQTFLKMMRDKN